MSGPVIAVLQARVSSSRLPGKVLAPILGTPMIVREIERVRRARKVDRLVVATSDDKTDGTLETLCRDQGVEVFRGSLNDVLDRFYRAAKAQGPSHVVRLTGDCPLIDPDIIDRVVTHHVKGGFDYTSNALEATFPDGLDCEVMAFTALETAWKEAKLPSEREHVTPFLWKNRERFRVGVLKCERDLSALRWTVDEPADLEFVRAVYEALWKIKPDFGMDDVLELLVRRPDLVALNGVFRRNEGYEKSIREENPR